jgi:endoglucanase
MENNKCELTDWLKAISEVPGPSGFERRVRDLMVQRLDGACEVLEDKIGSVIFKKQGLAKGPTIMLAAHMDEIGFLVKTVTKEGFLKFVTLGGWWEHVMLGQRVTVMSPKGDIPGVIGSKPPHVLSPEERKKIVMKKEMYIDIGAIDKKDAEERMGVTPGVPVVPFTPFTPMANPDFLIGKAWDDRVGCAVLTDVLQQLGKIKHPNTVFGVGTVQEEVGCRGAKTSSDVIGPHIAIAVDTCISGDTPGISEDQASAKLGGGVAICIYDASLIPHVKLRDFVMETARTAEIPFQLEFSEGGGTDGGEIHLHAQGVPSIVLSVPTRYIHSHIGIISRKDYDSAVRLIIELVKKLDNAKVQNLLA